MEHGEATPAPRGAEAALHPAVLGWISSRGWTGLRPIQSRAVEAILRHHGDLVISAGTASGKTEAAFLPCISSLVANPSSTVGILAISPLRSLINDQAARLGEIGRACGLQVTAWHGETARESKQKVRRQPQGIVIITPESLEAMLLNRRGDMDKLLGGLRYVVVDELHVFLAGDRGAQVASLLARLDRILGRRTRRIGLSATLGDPEVAAAWLNPIQPESVTVLEEEASRRRIATRVECVVEHPLPPGTDEVQAAEMGFRTGLGQIAERLYPRLAGGKNLVFAASRRTVEALADGLRRQAETRGVENAFFPHHGSLAKGFRERVEAALREPGVPATAVATTTLELGIDIGEVERVVQVGPPRSLAGLRQRVGRSGRREGRVPTLDLMVIARTPPGGAHPTEELHTDLVGSLAAVVLLHRGFVEPPGDPPASLSVLVHQVVCICAKEIVDADALVRHLRLAAPFQAFTAARIRELLVRLSAPDCGVLERMGGGLVRLGPLGHDMVGRAEIFSVFTSPVEMSLSCGGTRLGSVPMPGGSPVAPGDLILFQGQRWSVERIDVETNTAHVVPAPKAASLRFDGGEPAPVHDRLFRAMRQVYESDLVPGNLDVAGRYVLFRARAAYRKLSLSTNAVHRVGADVVILPFLGTLKLRALALALQAEGLRAHATGVSVLVEGIDTAAAHRALAAVARGRGEALRGLLETTGVVPEGKFDGMLDPAFRTAWWAEVNGIAGLARESAAAICAMPGPPGLKGRSSVATW